MASVAIAPQKQESQSQVHDMRALLESLTPEQSKGLLHHIQKFVRNYDDALDVLQDAYAKVLSVNGTPAAYSGDAGCSFFTWLWRVCTNYALMRVRYQTYRKQRDNESLDAHDYRHDNGRLFGSVHSEHYNGASPEHAAMNAITRRSIDAAIDCLPHDQRLVVQARLVNELSMQETADLYGWSIPKVKACLFRARTELAKTLSPLR